MRSEEHGYVRINATRDAMTVVFLAVNTDDPEKVGVVRDTFTLRART